MNPQLIYLFVFIIFILIAVLLQKRYCVLCDSSIAKPRPYSFARLQLIWWTFIVLVSFISIIIASGQIPTFDPSTLKLLGIGVLTTGSARIIDIADDEKFKTAAATAAAASTLTGTTTSVPLLNKDQPSQGFWLDILSDKSGVSVHRLQAFIFNLVFGAWFIYKSIEHIVKASANASPKVIDEIIPVITNNNLILLGISAGTYVALKVTENK